MSYQPHAHEPAPQRTAEPDGGITGYAAIKYTALVIIVLAIIGFMVWAIGQFV